MINSFSFSLFIRSFVGSFSRSFIRLQISIDWNLAYRAFKCAFRWKNGSHDDDGAADDGKSSSTKRLIFGSTFLRKKIANNWQFLRQTRSFIHSNRSLSNSNHIENLNESPYLWFWACYFHFSGLFKMALFVQYIYKHTQNIPIGEDWIRLKFYS